MSRYPTGKQQIKVLEILLEANGEWVSKHYFIRELNKELSA